LAGPDQTRIPARIQIAGLLADPNTSPELKAALRELEGTGDEGLRTKLEVEKLILDLRTAREAGANKEQTRQIARDSAEAAVSKSRSAVVRMIEINDQLDNTIAASGFAPDEKRTFAAGLGFIKDTFGADSSQERQAAALADEFDALANQLAIDETIRVASQEGGVKGSVALLNATQAAKPSRGRQTAANRTLLNGLLKTFDNFALINGFDQGLLPQAPAPATNFRIESIPGFKDMTTDQQNELRLLIQGPSNG
jgi:hypothetical protein